MTTLVTEHLGDGVFFVQGEDVNWLLIREGSDLIAVDCGYPGYREGFEASVRAIGARLEDLRAVLLTHSHVDHMGGANYLHETYGTPVYLDAVEVPLARRERIEQAGPLDIARNIWRPGVVSWTKRIVAAGALKDSAVSCAEAFVSSGPLDLPGRPVPISTRGHTSGHTAYLFPDTGVIATGDALVTAHAVTSIRGPQVLPGYFNHSEAVTGLNSLVDLPADRIAPGHGPAVRMSITDAVAQARGRL